MEGKKVVAAALAVTIASSAAPINVTGESDDITLGYSVADEESDLMLMSAENIEVSKKSETDTSITVSWGAVENVSTYAVICNGVESGTTTDTEYTITGLTGGAEYRIYVKAYDSDGNLVNTSSTIYTYTDWNITSDTVLTSDKTVADLTISSGDLDLNGYTLTVKGDTYLTSSSLNVNKGKLYVTGNFNLCDTNGRYSNGYLVMEKPEDYICVAGDFLAHSYYSNTLIDGSIEVKGNFTQKYSGGTTENFNPSKNHKVILSGDKLQTVSFARVESGFNTLEIQNFSKEGVVFNTSVTISNLVDNGCNVSFSNGEREGWTLEADETIEGNLFLSRGTLDLNGHKLTVTGNLIHSGGTVLVNNGELEVQGDYRVQSLNGETYENSSGVLNMTNEADTVNVDGHFVMQSTASHSGKLTAGTMYIGGDLTQLDGGSYYNFCTSGTHTVIMDGSEKQTISIYDNSKDDSRINNLKITNTSSEGVNFAGKVYVINELYNTDSVIENVTNLQVASTTIFADRSWNSDIAFSENYTLADDLSIGGTAYLTRGTLKLNGHKLLVNGDFNFSDTDGDYSNGYLNMTAAEDFIRVNGDFFVYSYSSNTLSDGVIEVEGDFIQKYRSNAYNFAPSGNHKVILSGESLQTVSFERSESRFNILEIQNYSEEGIVFSTPVTINELIDNGCNVSFANNERSGWTLEADETIEGDLYLSRGTLDLNGHKLTITGNLVHSGGTVLVNSGELEVQGDYRIQSQSGETYGNSTGVLNMTNEADTVNVDGQFVMQSTESHNGKLTAGTMYIGGDVSQVRGGSYYNFYTSGTHTVVLDGSEKQTISIYDNGKNESRINNLKITNVSSEGVIFDSGVYVINELYDTESVIENVTNLKVASTAIFADGNWSHDVNFTENYTLNSDLSIGGTVYLTYGTLKLNGHRLLVEGDFNFSSLNGSGSYGYLNMTNADDYICVNGNFLANSYYSSTLTDGVIEVKGDFTQKYQNIFDNFAPSGNHKVILSGDGLQTVSFKRTESGFNILEIQNYSEEGVAFSTPVTINELIDNGCNVIFANGERSGWTLEADETIEGDLFLSRGELNLNGHKLTITGNLVHSGGTVFINNGELEIQGDYRIQSLNGENYGNSAGILNMTNEADTVNVDGQFVMQSTVDHRNTLTSGVMYIGGNFAQLDGGSNYNFCASGTHTVVFDGFEKQTVQIYDNSKDYSRINNLKITNTSSEGVAFSNSIYVTGELYNTESIIANAKNIRAASTTVFADGTWGNDIDFAESYALNSDLSIGGTVYLTSGTLKLNGHRLTVDKDFNLSSITGNYYTRSYLDMSNPEDYLYVNGNMLIYAYDNSTLTDGVIEVKGDLTQKNYLYGYSANFVPTGNHKIILSGESLQTVSFEKTESRINILEIRNYSEEGVVFSTPVTINELIDNGCNITFANGERAGWTLEADETIEGDLFLARGTLDLNGHKLTITGNLVHSGGTVLVNSGELEVHGDYRVQSLNGDSYKNSAGVLNMTNDADVVNIDGQFVMQSTVNHSDKLAAGTMYIGGNLIQNSGANGCNFFTSGTHTVILDGSEKQVGNL